MKLLPLAKSEFGQQKYRNDYKLLVVGQEPRNLADDKEI